MRSTKVVAACIFNELQAAGLFLALDATSTRTDPSTSGRKYRKSVNNSDFIRNESLFVVSTAVTSASQLKHTPRLLRSICPEGYEIWTIEYGKILVMLLSAVPLTVKNPFISRDIFAHARARLHIVDHGGKYSIFTSV